MKADEPFWVEKMDSCESCYFDFQLSQGVTLDTNEQPATRNRTPTHYTQEIDQRYSKNKVAIFFFFFFHSYLFIGSPLLFVRDIIRTRSKYDIPIELWAMSYLRVSTSQVEPVLESIWNSTHSSQMVENETRHQLNRNGNSTGVGMATDLRLNNSSESMIPTQLPPRLFQ